MNFKLPDWWKNEYYIYAGAGILVLFFIIQALRRRREEQQFAFMPHIAQPLRQPHTPVVRQPEERNNLNEIVFRGNQERRDLLEERRDLPVLPAHPRTPLTDTEKIAFRQPGMDLARLFGIPKVQVWDHLPWEGGKSRMLVVDELTRDLERAMRMRGDPKADEKFREWGGLENYILLQRKRMRRAQYEGIEGKNGSWGAEVPPFRLEPQRIGEQLQKIETYPPVPRRSPLPDIDISLIPITQSPTVTPSILTPAPRIARDYGLIQNLKDDIKRVEARRGDQQAEAFFRRKFGGIETYLASQKRRLAEAMK